MRCFLTVVSLTLASTLNGQIVVLNGASFRPEQPVTNGSWVTAFGSFPGVTAATAPGYPLPTVLGGVTVSIDGAEAPLYYVSGSQINFLIPYRTSPGLRAVQVRTAGGTLNGSVRVMTAAPGLFVKDATQQRPPKGAILNQDGTENASSNPVRRGQVVSIFATGPGALVQPVQDGTAAPSSPLVTTQTAPQVYIGGVEAQVQFSGLAPGFAGLWQINALVPDRAFIAGSVPVQVFMNGVDSNEVLLFVSQ